MSFEVTVTPTVYNVEVEVNPSVQPFDVQVITQQDLADLVDEAKQYAEDAEDSADSASASASSASASASASASSANSASASASSASGSANTATTQAGIATTQAGIATTQAGIATTKAQEANQSASDALASEQASAQSASDALQSEQNALASEQASALSEANALASEQSASASASTATAQAGIATTQAGIATTQAGNALTSANNALNSANAAAASASSASQTGTSTLLTGFATGSNTTIAGTDTILQAFQKAQGQINARVSGTGANGQVAFWSGTGTQSGDSNLFWDNVNKRLGVGTNAPLSPVHIKSNVTGTATSNFRIDNGGTASNEVSLEFFSSASDSASSVRSGRIRSYFTGSSFASTVLTFQSVTTGNALIDTLSLNNGNVIIGSTINAGFRLDVNGIARIQENLTINRSADARIIMQESGVTNAVIQVISTAFRINSVLNLPIEFLTNSNLRWSITNTGVFQSNGAQTIQTSTGNLTLATGGGNGNIILSPNGAGLIGLRQGNVPVMVGADSNANSFTVNTNKRGRVSFPRYDNNTHVGMIMGLSNVGTNIINIGGIQDAYSVAPDQIRFFIGASYNATTDVEVMRLTSTSNVLINTTTDAGFRLDVNGTARVQGALTVTTGGASITGLSTIQGTTASDSGQLGSELLTTGTGDASWTGSSFATGYTHVAGSTTTLTSTLAGVVNNFYQITYTVTNRTAGSFTIAFGGFTSSALTATGAVGPQATTTGTLVITPTSDFNGTIVLSIRVISVSSASVSFISSSGLTAIELRSNNINSNTFIGNASGRNNTTGFQNVFYGGSAGRNNTTGSNNTLVGLNAGSNNSTGLNNTFIGISSGSNLRIQSNNTFVGGSSGFNLTSGERNVLFGREAGFRIADASNLTQLDNSVFLGVDTRANSNGETNQIVIGHTAIGLGSNTTVIGNSSTTFGRWWGNLLIGTSTNQASSVLTMESTTRGFLPPRMTSTERNAIATPATGLVVYNTTDNRLSVYNGTAWVNLATV